jgi:uncharacterized protein with ParB-like and HNH nuclease domain
VKEQLEPLWEQVESKASEILKSGSASFPHYMGSLLVIPEGEAAFGQVQAYDVVDGQQRITTFHLIFSALRAIARECDYTDLAKNIESLLLISEDSVLSSSPAGRYKLQPTTQDRDLFRNLVDFETDKLRQVHSSYFYNSGKHKKTKAPATLAAYSFFYEHVWAFLETDSSEQRNRFRAISEAVYQSFRFIVITLSKEDDPQVIFETLNTGGKPLAAMDLVRNDVFLRAMRRNESAEDLMKDYWSVFETPFWKEPRTQGRLKKPTMDFFLTHALGAETGKFVSPSEVYSEYKKYTRTRETPVVEDELKAIVKYVEPYRTLADPGSDSPLDRLGELLVTFETSTAYPAILLIATSQFAADMQDRLYTLIGSYVVRRALCNLGSKNYNVVFSDLTAEFKSRGVSESSFAKLFEARKNSEAARFPSDKDLTEAILDRDQYNTLPTNRLRFVLTQLELALRDKFSATSDLKPGLWVEHIMPRSWRDHWPLISGKAAPAIDAPITDAQLIEEVRKRERDIHTLGNLTLLTPASNASAGHASFAEKKSRLLGSLTSMNASLAQLEKWDELDIVARSKDLAKLAIEVWPYPTTVS